ncbi:MAG: Ser/Thr protein phosphatase family protein [Labilithrix sp.]|nr:Ser/Thr protein phosphatase family protein [Labilithrix sp.]
MIALRYALGIGALVAVAGGLSAIGACSSDGGATADAPDASSPEDDAATPDNAPPCPPSGVAKGPWAIGMTRTSVIVRWESCRAGAVPGLVYQPESGGADVSVATAERAVVLTQKHTAVLAPQHSPDDLPGTVYMHDAAISGLTAGTCYGYHLAADAARAGRFCTSQPDGGKVHFLAIGDTNPLLSNATSNLLARVVPMKADFVVHGGDIQYYDSFLETWAGWFPSMQPLLSLGAIQPALGNHEHETDDELDDYSLRYFGHPNFGGDTMWYRYESGGVWFHVLDTEQPIEPGTPQGTWLSAGLTEVAAKPGFRASILVMHRPLATCGDSAENDGARKGFASAFAQYKVPLVIQAHVHGYERFEIDGVTYVTTGGGGGLIGDMNANVSRAECPMRKVSGGFFHAMDVVIDGKSLSATVIDEGGTTRDTFAIALP